MSIDAPCTITDGTSALADLPAGLPFLGMALPACADPAASAAFDQAGSAHDSRKAIRTAIGTCKGCPYLFPCREWALEHDERWGVWGGMSLTERRKEIRRRAKKAYLESLRNNGSGRA